MPLQLWEIHYFPRIHQPVLAFFSPQHFSSLSSSTWHEAMIFDWWHWRGSWRRFDEFKGWLVFLFPGSSHTPSSTGMWRWTMVKKKDRVRQHRDKYEHGSSCSFFSTWLLCKSSNKNERGCGNHHAAFQAIKTEIRVVQGWENNNYQKPFEHAVKCVPVSSLNQELLKVKAEIKVWGQPRGHIIAFDATLC